MIKKTSRNGHITKCLSYTRIICVPNNKKKSLKCQTRHINQKNHVLVLCVDEYGKK